MINISTVPELLRNDKTITSFIARSAELEGAEPIVSYYCKLFVLEHILNNKIHTQGIDAEVFTVKLLEETESAKANADDDLRIVLGSKQLSLNYVFLFSMRLFSSCLEDLRKYDGVMKNRIVQKVRATLNFWALLPLLSGDADDPVDFAKTTGGRCASEEEFVAFAKEKTKVLKWQLSRVLKDEVPVQDEEKELRELEELASSADSTAANPATTGESELKAEHEAEDEDGLGFPATPSTFPDTPRHVTSSESAPTPHVESASREESTASPDLTNDSFSLPGAPKFDPSALADKNSDSESAPINLPGAPKLLPDDDLSKVNKTSSIHVFSPESESGNAGTKKAPEEKPAPVRRVSSNVTHVTKETLSSIVDTTEQIAKIQKHAKFAISALNYEDLATAEAELVKGLEMLRGIKDRA